MSAAHTRYGQHTLPQRPRPIPGPATPPSPVELHHQPANLRESSTARTSRTPPPAATAPSAIGDPPPTGRAPGPQSRGGGHNFTLYFRRSLLGEASAQCSSSEPSQLGSAPSGERSADRARASARAACRGAPLRPACGARSLPNPKPAGRERGRGAGLGQGAPARVAASGRSLGCAAGTAERRRHLAGDRRRAERRAQRAHRRLRGPAVGGVVERPL